ncbi:hypothetical protein AgCh_014974 [Apium graveolens]
MGSARGVDSVWSGGFILQVFRSEGLDGFCSAVAGRVEGLVFFECWRGFARFQCGVSLRSRDAVVSSGGAVDYNPCTDIKKSFNLRRLLGDMPSIETLKGNAISLWVKV